MYLWYHFSEVFVAVLFSHFVLEHGVVLPHMLGVAEGKGLVTVRGVTHPLTDALGLKK